MWCQTCLLTLTYQIILRHAKLYYIVNTMPNHTQSCRIILWNGKQYWYFSVPNHTVPCCSKPCCVMLIPCHATPYHIMSNHTATMLCKIISWHAQPNFFIAKPNRAMSTKQIHANCVIMLSRAERASLLRVEPEVLKSDQNRSRLDLTYRYAVQCTWLYWHSKNKQVQPLKTSPIHSRCASSV